MWRKSKLTKIKKINKKWKTAWIKSSTSRKDEQWIVLPNNQSKGQSSVEYSVTVLKAHQEFITLNGMEYIRSITEVVFQNEEDTSGPRETIVYEDLSDYEQWNAMLKDESILF